MKTKRTAEDLSAKRLLRRTLPAAFVLLAVVLAFTAPAAAAEDTSWYTGHESDTTFTLTTADQLAGLASLVNSGNTFEGKTVKLGGDITISGDWTPSVKPSTPTTPNTPEIPDTQKVTDETREIPTTPENIETLPTGDKVVVVALDNTEVIQSVAVPEAVAQANPEASVKVTEGGNAPALPENVAADDVHIVVGVSIVDKEGNPVKITESGYFILDADVPAGKKLVV